MSVEGLKEEELGKFALTSCMALFRNGIPMNMRCLYRFRCHASLNNIHISSELEGVLVVSVDH